MNASQLTQRIALLSQTPPVAPLTAYGDPTVYANVWAAPGTMRGFEVVHYEQLGFKVTAKFTIWYHRNVARGHLVRTTDPQSQRVRTYQINDVVDVDLKHVWQELYCTEAA